jgi:hypothetical protein
VGLPLGIEKRPGEDDEQNDDCGQDDKLTSGHCSASLMQGEALQPTTVA